MPLERVQGTPDVLGREAGWGAQTRRVFQLDNGRETMGTLCFQVGGSDFNSHNNPPTVSMEAKGSPRKAGEGPAPRAQDAISRARRVYGNTLAGVVLPAPHAARRYHIIPAEGLEGHSPAGGLGVGARSPARVAPPSTRPGACRATNVARCVEVQGRFMPRLPGAGVGRGSNLPPL
jgi:hypothetical protein